MRHRAFTLIELMVVVTVIGVLSALAVTSFHGSLGKTRLDESAQGLFITVRYARQYAVMHQRDCRVVFVTDAVGSDRPGYRLEVVSDDPESGSAFRVLRTGAAKPVSLPSGVSFSRVLIEGIEPGTDSVVTFRPTGEADAASIQLTDDRRTWSVLIDPGTGRVELADRAVNQTPNMREDLDA